MKKHAVISSYGSKNPRTYYGYIVVVASFIVLVTFWGATHGFGVFLKSLTVEFGWTRAMTSGAYSLSMFVMGLSYIVSGRLTDRFGPRIVVTICGFIFGTGYLLMSQITTIWQLYLIYGVVIAIGMSGGSVPMASTVTRWFTKRRGLMTGIVLSGIGGGVMIGPLVSGLLISNNNWRLSYLTIGISAMILLIIISQFLRRDPAKLGQLPYGDTEITGGELVLANRELSYQEAAHTKQFWMIFFTNMLLGIILNSITVHIVPHLTDLGIPVLRASSIPIVMGTMHIIGTIIAGVLTDKIGNKRVFFLGLAMLLIALLSLQVFKELGMLYLFAIVFGFGHGIAGILVPLTAARFFGIGAQGAILGTIIFAWAIGGMIGPVVTGHVFDITSNYHPAFWGLALLSFAGLMLVSSLKPLTRD